MRSLGGTMVEITNITTDGNPYLGQLLTLRQGVCGSPPTTR